jgi:hypothetical protein
MLDLSNIELSSSGPVNGFIFANSILLATSYANLKYK